MSPPTETLRNVAHSTRFNDIFSELLTASGHHASCLPYRCIIAFSIGIIRTRHRQKFTSRKRYVKADFRFEHQNLRIIMVTEYVSRETKGTTRPFRSGYGTNVDITNKTSNGNE